MNTLFDLTGQVAVITGGAGMLGARHAAAIAGAGGHAVIADLSLEVVTRLASEMTAAHGVEAFGVQVDVTEKSQVDAMAAAVMHGIRVNCLSPGGVYAGHDPQFVKNLVERIPLGRMAQANEYHGAVLFLVSAASSYMTGANLIIDGGRTAW